MTDHRPAGLPYRASQVDLTPRFSRESVINFARLYDDVVRQGVPDRFVDLIRKLDGPVTPDDSGNGPASNTNEGRD